MLVRLITPHIGQIALWVVVVTALVSAVDYFRRFGGLLLNPKIADVTSSKFDRNRKVG